MNFFWPAALNPDSSTGARLGRVLHWGALLIGLTPAGIACVIFLSDGDFELAAALFVGIWAVVLALIGRGPRYILSAE